ncbi:hypothetical protein M3Y95_00521400 [Aphelenchoides besseyi]|nr:hypothetical protein M3Y95_00521400 [Aphelenchoides besseyi]
MEFYYAEHPTWSMQHWRELDGSKYTLSRHLYKDRFLPYYEHSEYTKFGILDLLHMKTKKFLIQQNTEPISSRDSPYCSFRLFMGKVMLIDFHTVIAEICDIFNELTEFIVLHLDYENATATFKFPIQLNGDTGHSYPCWTKTLTDSFECIFEQGRNMRHRHFAYYKISYLNDGDLEQKFIQQIDYPKEFFINGVVNNNVYGFWAEDWEKSDLSNLVQFCVETKEQKTLKLSGWPTDLKYNYYGDALDRSIISSDRC